MSLLSSEYDYHIALRLDGEHPTFYVKNKINFNEPGFLFDPGFSIDEVEGLVDFVYGLLDLLDDHKCLSLAGEHRRLTFVDFTGSMRV